MSVDSSLLDFLGSTKESARPVSRPILQSQPAPLTEDSLRDFLRAPRARRRDGKYDFPILAPFELVARHRGERIFSRWFEGVSPFRVIEAALAEAPMADGLELCATTGFRPLDAKTCSGAFSPRNSGRFAAQVVLDGTVYRVSPLETVATNRTLELWFDRLLKTRGLTKERLFALGGRVSLLECRQFVITCGQHPTVSETFRGNEVVEPGLEALELCNNVVAGMGRWFMNNLGVDGSLPYKYWPSSGKYSEADNPIRRFMATIALNRLAATLDRRDMKLAAKHNLEFNLRRFYRKNDGLGHIEWDGSVKLGAVALAGLAILESPFRDQWRSELMSLRATVDRLWQPDGSFRTFLLPADRNDNQNFYPGEALLFLALSLKAEFDEALLQKTLRGLWTYRDRFLRNPNPAFVPWHAQAASVLYELTGGDELRSYVYELNDWLLPHQQWGGSLDKDLWGRFYSPHRPDYGPPHASSTGVYLEGIVDALKIAKVAKDTRREEIYAQAFLRGLRSIAQLQFKNDVDAFYVAHKDRVIGAVRTEAYDNEIRVDNVQHALMALLKYKALSGLEKEPAAAVVERYAHAG